MLHTPCELREVHGGDRIERVTLEDTATGSMIDLDCDALILQLGFVEPARPDREVGPRGGRQEAGPGRPDDLRDPLPGVFAAGDVAYYDGKITLITIGLGEAAIAANQCIARIARREGAADLLDRVAPIGAWLPQRSKGAWLRKDPPPEMSCYGARHAYGEPGTGPASAATALSPSSPRSRLHSLT